MSTLNCEADGSDSLELYFSLLVHASYFRSSTNLAASCSANVIGSIDAEGTLKPSESRVL